MGEFNPFRSDRAPLTNWVGHQVSKGISAGSSALQKVRNHNIDFKHAYQLKLMQEQKYDFIRGNALTAIALMTAALISNSIK